MKPLTMEECGCCEVGVSPTPEDIRNRPGLSAIAYRVGTYASFRQAMIGAIAKSPELADWSARQSDDIGIALMEMWAYIADILTFYQERIANEAFLRTALHRDTIMRLATMLDYELKPGVAATTDLAFFVEEGAEVNIPVGLRVQGVPGQDKKPQKFETVEAITADARLNQVRVFPKPQPYNPFSWGRSGGTLISDPGGLAPGDRLVVFDEIKAECKEISDVSAPDNSAVLSWTPKIQGRTFQPFTTRIFDYDRQFRLFGYNAPHSYLEPTPDASGNISWATQTCDFRYQIPSEKTIALDALYDDLKPNTQILIVQSGSSEDAPVDFARLATITNVTSQAANFGPLQDTVTQLSLDLSVQIEPVVIESPDDSLDLFTIGDDGALWISGCAQTRTSWGPWESLGGQINMLAVGRTANYTEVFARGKDGALWHINAFRGRWNDWKKLNDMNIDRLALSRNENGRLEVFSRGVEDQALWHMWQYPNGSWSGWFPLGERRFKIEMFAVSRNLNQGGRLELFAIWQDHSLAHIWQEYPSAVTNWSDWHSLGGRKVDRLAVARNYNGDLEVFARDLESKCLLNMRQQPSNDDWSEWIQVRDLQIDMIAAGDMDTGQGADKPIEIYVRGLDDKKLYYNCRLAASDNWQVWNQVFSEQIELLAVSQEAEWNPQVLACAKDRILKHRQRDESKWVWVSLGPLMWTILDRTQVRILELTEGPFGLWDRQYHDFLMDSENTAYVPLEKLRSLEPGRTLILDDHQAEPQTVTVVEAVPVDLDGDGNSDYLAITFAPNLARMLNTKTAILYGNVAKASHGETVPHEILGSGDASTEFQRFVLKKSPTTFVPMPDAPRGARNTLEVRVGGVLWKEVESLYGQRARDQVYTARVNHDGDTSVRFGDGKTGARLPTGQDNVVAKYRQGIGSDGDVHANSLTTLLDRPLALKRVTNPKQAEGGTDPEDSQEARLNAPNTVRTFGRVVSLRDYEDLARSYTGIARAKAVRISEHDSEAIQLTIVGENGLRITESSPIYKSFVAYLNLHRDTNHRVKVVAHDIRQVVLKVVIQVHPTYMDEEVLPLARKAVMGYFDGLQLGQGIHLSNVYSIVQAPAGVAAAVIEYFDYKGAGSIAIHDQSGKVIVIPSLKEYLAVEPNEIAALYDADLQIATDLT